jgi:hypothetical protein
MARERVGNKLLILISQYSIESSLMVCIRLLQNMVWVARTWLASVILLLLVCFGAGLV